MSMGSTGTVNVSPEMMNNALAAIEEYRTTTGKLHQDLADSVNGMIPSSFSGSAATGFKNFYDNKIDPLAGENLTKLLDALRDICDGILKAIPAEDGVDEALAQGNNQ